MIGREVSTNEFFSTLGRGIQGTDYGIDVWNLRDFNEDEREFCRKAGIEVSESILNSNYKKAKIDITHSDGGSISTIDTIANIGFLVYEGRFNSLQK